MIEPSHEPRPLISVIIIFLNARQFLDEAVASVRGQRYPHWELLLVDDGSTDESTPMARAYAAQDSRIRYVEHEGHANRGMSASRNLGVSRARGEWIAFLDSDDVWLPDALELQLAAAEQHPVTEFVYGPALTWHSWDPASARCDEVQDLETPAGPVADGPALAAHFIERGRATPCTGSLMVRRSTFIRLGGFEESFGGMYEDQAFCIKAALGSRVLVAPRSGLLYRQHDASCSSVAFSTNGHGETRLRFLRWASRYLAATHVRDPRLTHTVRTHLRTARWSTGAPGLVWKGVRHVLPEPVRQWIRRKR